MTLDMANLGPNETGVGSYIHVFQDLDRHARRAPRIKVFRGSPGDGDVTVIVVPTADGVPARVKGRCTVGAQVLRRAKWFAESNWRPLLRYWSDPTMGVVELLSLLQAVE